MITQSTPETLLPLSAGRRLQEIGGREEEVVAAFLRLRSDAAVARELGLHVRRVRRLIDASVPEARVLRRARRTASQAYADQDLVCALREAARELPPPLAIESYRRWAQAKSNRHPCPGPEVIILRFAGWRRALVRAGLPSNARHGPHAAYDYATVVGAIAAALREMRGYPSVVRYDAWRAGRVQIPSAATARRFARSWDDLLADAYLLVYGIDGERLPGELAETERRRQTKSGSSLSGDPVKLLGQWYESDESAEGKPASCLTKPAAGWESSPAVP